MIIVFLVTSLGVLTFNRITLLLTYSQELIIYHGSQGVKDIIYNFSSSFANSESEFTGIDTSTDYFNYITAIAIFIGRVSDHIFFASN